MVSFSDYDNIEATHLRRLLKLNLIFLFIPFISAIYDFIYLTMEIVIGGFIFNFLLFVLIYQLKNYNPRIRLTTIVWLILVLVTSIYVIIENFSGSVEDVDHSIQIVVASVWSFLSIYFFYGLYTLLFDTDTKALYDKS